MKMMGRAGESALKVTHFLLNKCFAMDQINANAKSGSCRYQKVNAEYNLVSLYCFNDLFYGVITKENHSCALCVVGVKCTLNVFTIELSSTNGL